MYFRNSSNHSRDTDKGKAALVTVAVSSPMCGSWVHRCFEAPQREAFTVRMQQPYGDAVAVSEMPDPLYLSIWFSTFEADDMLPHALAVMRQFPFPRRSLELLIWRCIQSHGMNLPSSNSASGLGFHRNRRCLSRPTCCTKTMLTCSKLTGIFGFLQKMGNGLC